MTDTPGIDSPGIPSAEEFGSATVTGGAESEPTAAPEVRQCQDPEYHLFGAVAVSAGVNRWGVMHPLNGGHWADDEEVKNWKILA
jgi:hypothetical protein